MAATTICGDFVPSSNSRSWILKDHAKPLQSCPTLYDPTDSSPPGSPVPRILQARTLEWVAIFFSNAWRWKVKGKSLSRVWLLATPWTAAYQAPLSMGFSRQEYWSGVPLPSPKGQYWDGNSKKWSESKRSKNIKMDLLGENRNSKDQRDIQFIKATYTMLLCYFST